MLKSAKFTRLSLCVVLLVTGIAQEANAGLIRFSRANCVSNESIAWDWPGNRHWLWTNSHHWDYQKFGWEPAVVTRWEYTFRSAAVHWGEGFREGYYVWGDHWRYDQRRRSDVYLGHSEAEGCNLQYIFPNW